ncbi:dehydrodolichyl diphosphate synthase complex subunit DHDDS isoform X2 [Ooceraea biroi]|uniref:dehydrodolichyl diphosphate synthase complex subunit DHDDS isoform X2 n=1 Tax=Ooceraea biroi TaxID=2015173 RepID=UPI0005BBB44D|nr:dehydrodolichyl diphosphate synthase complex subunit DHDDS isoform X2 [Ooceraea biroi]
MFEKMSEALGWCTELGITEITVYAFSIDNFKRSKEEVDDLMELARQKFQGLLDNSKNIMENGVCIRVIGNLSLLPENIRKLISQVIIMTKNNNKTNLNIAFAYTSRDEITNAIKDITTAVKRTDILPEDINEDLISDCLYTYHSTNPDLLIRTSGEIRLSDFLMWQISETCLYFSNVLWPEFCVWDFIHAIFYYQKCYPDIKRMIKKQSLVRKHNNRVATYVDKLHHERESMIENFSLPAVQS